MKLEGVWRFMKVKQGNLASKLNIQKIKYNQIKILFTLKKKKKTRRQK